MRILTLILALLLQTGQPAASELDIIELNNRTAEEIIPLLQPLLNPDESLSGRGFQLILKADAARQSQIRSLVSKLDRAAAQLMISVFQGSERDLRSLGIDAGIRYQDNNTDVRTGSDASPGTGTSIGFQGKHAQVTGKVISTKARMQDNPVYRLRITEGTAGYISTGKSIPYFSGNVYQQRGQNLVESSVAYKDVTSGFYVKPRLNGNRVTLDISPRRDSLDPSRAGAINTRSATTTISGTLGQWIPLGGTSTQMKRSTSGPGKHYSTQDRYSESIWIKAEKVQ